MINAILIYLILLGIGILFLQGRSENDDITECKNRIRLEKFLKGE